MPKFHDRKSLAVGIIAGVFLLISGVFHGVLIVGIVQSLIGAILAVHCFDMIKYYKKHRIIKIEKSDTHRIITKQ